MAMWQSIVKITLTSLLSGLVVVIIAVLLNLRFTRTSLYEILLSRTKIIIFFFALLILLMPAVFSLLRGELLSPEELAVYVKELLVSAAIVVSFSFTWKVLNVFSTSFAKLGTVTPFKDLYNALLAPRLGEVCLSNVEEMQIRSLAKWIDEGDITGWRELEEDVNFGDGLQPGVRSVVEWLLQTGTSRVKRHPVHTLMHSMVEWSWQVRKGVSTKPRHIRGDDYNRLESLLSR